MTDTVVGRQPEPKDTVARSVESNRRTDIARSAGRALDVLFLLSQEKGEITSSGLANRLQIPKSSLHDILSLLVQRRFVHRNPALGTYHLDVGVFELGSAYLDSLSVHDISGPVLARLAEETGLTCQLAVLTGPSVLYINKHVPNRFGGPRLVSDVGSKLPANCTALGKAMLAYLPTEQLMELYGELRELPRLTSRSITSLKELLRTLRR